MSLVGAFKLFAGQSYYFLPPSNLLRYHHSIFCQVKSYEPSRVVDLDLIVGFEKENVSHTLDNTLKLLAECSSVLLRIIRHNKKAGIDTIIKKCTLGVQVIKKNLDTDEGDPNNTGKWRLIEVRSSCTPTCWELRSHWKPPFEIMATIYLELLEQRSLDKIIMEEVCVLRVLPSQSVADHFLNANV